MGLYWAACNHNETMKDLNFKQMKNYRVIREISHDQSIIFMVWHQWWYGTGIVGGIATRSNFEPSIGSEKNFKCRYSDRILSVLGRHCIYVFLCVIVCRYWLKCRIHLILCFTCAVSFEVIFFVFAMLTQVDEQLCH